MKTQIFLDTDLAMGMPNSDIDDGFALALALADSKLDLRAIGTVNGNTDVYSATTLTKKLLAQLGRPDIPVYLGADRPLIRYPNHQELESKRKRISDTSPTTFAPVKLVELAHEFPKQLTVVAIGPLTNIAIALQIEPELPKLINEVVVMGGVFTQHTHRHSMPGEFNIWVDPEAAQIVVQSGLALRFVGLDVTLKTRISLRETEEMERSTNSFISYAGRCTRQWINHISEKFPNSKLDRDSCALHDPLAVAAVVHSDFLTWREVNVKFCCESEQFRGIALADFGDEITPVKSNCRIATDVNSDLFRQYFFKTLTTIYSKENNNE